MYDLYIANLNATIMSIIGIVSKIVINIDNICNNTNCLTNLEHSFSNYNNNLEIELYAEKAGQ